MSSPRAGLDSSLSLVTPLLWPPPLRGALERPRLRPGREQPQRQFLVLPNAHRPKRLIPLGSARATSTALTHGGGVGRRLPRLGASLEAFLAGTAATLWPSARFCVRATGPAGVGISGIEDHLAAVLDQPVYVSLRLGPPRANLKPVMQILSAEGRCLGFAKVGINPLTTALVAHEAQVLRSLPVTGTTVTPTVLHCGQWSDLLVLVLSPLTVPSGGRAPSASLVQTSMLEVAFGEPVEERRLDESGFAPAVDERLQLIADADLWPYDLAPMRRALSEHGGESFPFGRWHGDWHTGNMAAMGDRLLVWDWERSTTQVPLGFDALHKHLHEALSRRRAVPSQALATLQATAPALLEPFGVAPSRAKAWTRLYLTEVLSRYLLDGQSTVPVWQPLMHALSGALESW